MQMSAIHISVFTMDYLTCSVFAGKAWRARIQNAAIMRAGHAIRVPIQIAAIVILVAGGQLVVVLLMLQMLLRLWPPAHGQRSLALLHVADELAVLLHLEKAIKEGIYNICISHFLLGRLNGLVE